MINVFAWLYYIIFARQSFEMTCIPQYPWTLLERCSCIHFGCNILYVIKRYSEYNCPAIEQKQSYNFAHTDCICSINFFVAEVFKVYLNSCSRCIHFHFYEHSPSWFEIPNVTLGLESSCQKNNCQSHFVKDTFL